MFAIIIIIIIIIINTNQYCCAQATGKTYEAPEYRYVLTMRVTDGTGSTLVTAFNDEAVAIMSCSAGELKHMQDTDNDAYEAQYRKALFQELVVTVRCKTETYKEETRVRASLQRATHVDYVAESRAIVAALKALAV